MFVTACKTWHNKPAQNARNNELAAEYKEANDERRTEILTEYYESNEKFVNSWVRWDREHWAELTQMFVTHWHRAFSEYKPYTDTSVFNFYMDQKYKRWASEDYKRWLKRTNFWTGYELSSDGFKEESSKYRKELYVHPTSESDREILRHQLCRNLDDKERFIINDHFFGDMSHEETAQANFKMGKQGKKSKTPGGVSKYSYDYRQTVDSLMQKLRTNYRRDDF